MSWTLLGRPKTKPVTKSLAKEFAEMEPAPHDRPLSERRLAVYQKLLKDGSFRPVTWASAICKETGDIYRVNGKHTSIMLSGLDKMPDFYVTVEEYECDTLEDVAKLYATFDSAMMSRTAKDIYASFAGTIPTLKGVSGAIIGMAVTGLSMEQWGHNYNSGHQPAERAELLLEHPEFVTWLASLDLTTRATTHMKRTAVAAAMFATWKRSQKAATEFWMAVRDETGAKPDLPDRKLSKMLLTVGVDKGTGSTRAKKMNQREMFVRCLHAWNAWRKGEPTDLRYYEDKDIPAVK